MEDYEQSALRKKLIIAPFVGRLKTATLINFICAYVSWVNHFIFPHILLIEDYGKNALCNVPLTATFVERYKIATLTKPY